MKKRKRSLIETEDKALKKFLVNACKAYGGKMKDLEKLFFRMDILMPTQLKKFDGNATFFTSTGEKITLSQDEDLIITVQKGNLTKQYWCSLDLSVAELRSVIVEDEKSKVEIFLGDTICQITTPKGKLYTFYRELTRIYLKRLTPESKALEVLVELSKFVSN